MPGPTTIPLPVPRDPQWCRLREILSKVWLRKFLAFVFLRYFYLCTLGVLQYTSREVRAKSIILQSANHASAIEKGYGNLRNLLGCFALRADFKIYLFWHFPSPSICFTKSKLLIPQGCQTHLILWARRAALQVFAGCTRPIDQSLIPDHHGAMQLQHGPSAACGHPGLCHLWGHPAHLIYCLWVTEAHRQHWGSYI